MDPSARLCSVDLRRTNRAVWEAHACGQVQVAWSCHLLPAALVEDDGDRFTEDGFGARVLAGLS